MGIGHLMTGQLAMPFFRCVKNNPIYNLLVSHFDGVTKIDDAGGVVIFNNGVLSVSRLSPTGVNQKLEDMLAALDPQSFKPNTAVIVPEHRFAQAKQLYWQIVTEVVDQFFQENHEAISSPTTGMRSFGCLKD